MRRSRIKPSINLASRRSVSATPQPRDKAAARTPATVNSSQPKDGATSTAVGSRPKQHEEQQKGVVEAITEDTPGAEHTSTEQFGSSQSHQSAAAGASSSQVKDPAPSAEQRSEGQPVEDSTPSVATGGADTVAATPATSIADSENKSSVSTSSSSARKRTRFSAVPNLGQPRSRPLTPKPVIHKANTSSGHKVAAAAKTAADGEHVREDEEARAKDVGLMKPPPVQRMLSAPGIQKKAHESSPGPAIIASTGHPKQPPAASKGLDNAPLQSALKPTSTTFTKPAPPAPGEGRGADTDGKRVGQAQTQQANVYSRKLMELKEQIHDETPSKRRKCHPRTNSPDRAKMTMSDLIYYNPKDNPMKVSEAEKLNKKAKSDNPQKKLNFTNQEKENEKEKDSSDENASGNMAPQVKIGPNGEIIIDQSSLYVEASPARTFDPSDTELVHEDSSTTTYSSFRNRKQTAVWKAKDTQKFFRALSAVGTDFGTINAMFPNRTRAEIKRKFKREERMNWKKVDQALSDRKELVLSLFDPSSEEEEEEEVSKKKRSSRKKKGKVLAQKNGQIAKGKKVLADIAEQPDEEDQTDDTRSTGNAIESQDEAEEQPNLSNILSTTRYGRQPKVKTSYTIEIPPKQNRKRTRASPSQKPSEVKVFKSYAEQRLQRLQLEHDDALARKKLTRMQQSGVVEDDDAEDGRSDVTSEMMSEVGSEIANIDEVTGDSGLTSNLQSMVVLKGNSPAPVDRGFTSPVPNLNDPSLKKVVLLITTPDGKQTALQVNLASTEDSANASPGPSGLDLGGAGDFGLNLVTGGFGDQTPQRTFNLGQLDTQTGIGGVNVGSNVPGQSPVPVSSLTTLTNVSSPFQRASPQQQLIRTTYGSGNKQPTKPYNNAFTGKIMGGKIVSCPPQGPETSSLQGAPHGSMGQPSTSNTMPILPAGQTNANFLFSQKASLQSPVSLPHSSPSMSHNSLVNSTPLVPSMPMSSGLVDRGLVTGPIASEQDSADHLLTLPGSLPDLDMSLSLSGNLDVVAYEESIVTMSDPIIAQQVDVASSDPDGTISRRRKQRHRPHEPFIPPIK